MEENYAYSSVFLNEGLPVATVKTGNAPQDCGLVFPTSAEFSRAWRPGVFYLEIPGQFDVHIGRTFGQELLAIDCPQRKIPTFGKFWGFIALENNQQTKLTLNRPRWHKYYPPPPHEITKLGLQFDEMGRAIICEVLRQAGIPAAQWDRASGG